MLQYFLGLFPIYLFIRRKKTNVITPSLKFHSELIGFGVKDLFLKNVFLLGALDGFDIESDGLTGGLL